MDEDYSTKLKEYTRKQKYRVNQDNAFFTNQAQVTKMSDERTEMSLKCYHMRFHKTKKVWKFDKFKAVNNKLEPQK